MKKDISTQIFREIYNNLGQCCTAVRRPDKVLEELGSNLVNTNGMLNELIFFVKKWVF